MTALQIAGCFFGCLEDVAVEVRTSNFGLQAQLFVRRQCFDPTWHLAALRWPHAAAHGDSDLAPLRRRQCPSTHWPNSEGPGWCHLCRFWEKHNTIELLTSLSLRAFLKATWWQRHRGTVPVDAGDHTHLPSNWGRTVPEHSRWRTATWLARWAAGPFLFC